MYIKYNNRRKGKRGKKCWKTVLVASTRFIIRPLLRLPIDVEINTRRILVRRAL